MDVDDLAVARDQRDDAAASWRSTKPCMPWCRRSSRSAETPTLAGVQGVQRVQACCGRAQVQVLVRPNSQRVEQTSANVPKEVAS